MVNTVPLWTYPVSSTLLNPFRKCSFCPWCSGDSRPEHNIRGGAWPMPAQPSSSKWADACGFMYYTSLATLIDASHDWLFCNLYKIYLRVTRLRVSKKKKSKYLVCMAIDDSTISSMVWRISTLTPSSVGQESISSHTIDSPLPWSGPSVAAILGPPLLFSLESELPTLEIRCYRLFMCISVPGPLRVVSWASNTDLVVCIKAHAQEVVYAKLHMDTYSWFLILVFCSFATIG